MVTLNCTLNKSFSSYFCLWYFITEIEMKIEEVSLSTVPHLIFWKQELSLNLELIISARSGVAGLGGRERELHGFCLSLPPPENHGIKDNIYLLALIFVQRNCNQIYLLPQQAIFQLSHLYNTLFFLFNSLQILEKIHRRVRQ